MQVFIIDHVSLIVKEVQVFGAYHRMYGDGEYEYDLTYQIEEKTGDAYETEARNVYVSKEEAEKIAAKRIAERELSKAATEVRKLNDLIKEIDKLNIKHITEIDFAGLRASKELLERMIGADHPSRDS
jgi:hypothetical protein